MAVGYTEGDVLGESYELESNNVRLHPTIVLDPPAYYSKGTSILSIIQVDRPTILMKGLRHAIVKGSTSRRKFGRIGLVWHGRTG